MSGQSLERHLRYSASHHDDGEKTVLGRRGRWSGDDLVRLLLDQPATADRLAWRIASELLGEGVATPEERAALAEELRTSGLDIGAAVARVLRSERFFADDAVGRRVPGPVEWAVAAVRRFLPLDPPPSLVRLAEWSARMGQGLFYPPNVGGWPGGRAWLSPLALLGRANLAADLVAGRLARPAGKPLEVLGLALRHGCGGSREKLVRFLTDLILGGAPTRAGPIASLPQRERTANRPISHGAQRPQSSPPPRPSLGETCLTTLKFSGGSQNRAVLRTAAKRRTPIGECSCPT